MQKITELDQKSPIAEAFRTVRTNISFSDVDNESLRRASKELLKMYIENELCKFTSVNKQ